MEQISIYAEDTIPPTVLSTIPQDTAMTSVASTITGKTNTGIDTGSGGGGAGCFISTVQKTEASIHKEN